MTLATRIFYRKIHFLNSHTIPATGPAILIANHPGSLMDAALLGLLLNRPIHFFARGDIFKSRLIHRILNALHMHPIHHHQHNRSSLDVNDESFEIAINLLQKGALVLFFPEGFSHVEYFLLPFKKGTFRLAFQALEKNQHTSLPIVPVGFHYSHPTEPFSTVWVKAGSPIETAAFYAVYQANPAQAVRKLTDTAFEAIKKLTIQVPSSYATELFHLLALLRTDNKYQIAKSEDQWQMEKSISTNVEIIHEKVLDSYRSYRHLLKQNQLKEEELLSSNSFLVSKKNSLVCGLLAAPGLLLYAPPLFIAKRIADTKVTRIDFYAWILVAVAALLSICWIFLIFLAFTIGDALFAGIAFLIASIFSGWLTWKYAPCLIRHRQEQKLKKIPEPALQQIRVILDELISSLRAFLS